MGRGTGTALAMNSQPIKCARCGKAFIPPKNRTTPKYCTERCANTAKSRLANGRAITD